jgi:FKBP-type peptidyl-prolyl cis-trans isomerase
MHEPVTPPKRQVPYAWLVGGVAILSVCAMVMSVSNGTTANKNLDALIDAQSIASKNAEALVAAQSIAAKNAEALNVAQAAAATRERALQGQVDALSATLKEAEARQVSFAAKVSEAQAVDRANVQRMAEATNRINELTAELARLRDGSELKDAFARKNKAEADLDAASAALREANAKAAAALARLAEIDEENRRLREEITRIAGTAGRDIQRVSPRDDKWVKLNNEYLAKIDADKSVTKTASGLRYKIIEEGSAARPNASSTVKCRYEGMLVDGKIFDSTKVRNNEPTEFPLSGVIPAWTEGVQKIGAGGKILLYSPPGLAYGPEGQGPIPGNSVLTFEVELVEVTKYR